MDYAERYYARLFGNNDTSDIELDKDQLVSLAALTIDLKQPEWLDEIKAKLRAIS